MTESASLADWLSELGVARQLNNSDIMSGVTVNTVLTKIVPKYSHKLAGGNTAATRISNWNGLMYPCPHPVRSYGKSTLTYRSRTRPR